MARKKIAEFENVDGTLKACVYRDAEWNEYRVTFYAEGVKLPGSDGVTADYHTDDKREALDNAARYVWPDITGEMMEAAEFYAQRMGAKWKDQLALAWWLNEYSFFPFNDKAAALHNLRNTAGPSWLSQQPVKY